MSASVCLHIFSFAYSLVRSLRPRAGCACIHEHVYIHAAGRRHNELEQKTKWSENHRRRLRYLSCRTSISISQRAISLAKLKILSLHHHRHRRRPRSPRRRRRRYIVAMILIFLFLRTRCLSKKWWKRHEEKMRKKEREKERWREKKEGYRIGKKDEGSFCMLLLLVLLVAGSALFPKKIKQPTVPLLSFFFLLLSLSFFFCICACMSDLPLSLLPSQMVSILLFVSQFNWLCPVIATQYSVLLNVNLHEIYLYSSIFLDTFIHPNISIYEYIINQDIAESIEYHLTRFLLSLMC